MPLTPLADHKMLFGNCPSLDQGTCIVAALTGPPLGPVVVTVTVTGTGAPFRFTVDGLKLRVTPAGSCVLGKGLSTTVLGVFEAGVTLMTAD